MYFFKVFFQSKQQFQSVSTNRCFHDLIAGLLGNMELSALPIGTFACGRIVIVLEINKNKVSLFAL